MSKHYYICCAKYDIITYLAAGMEIYALLWVEQKKIKVNVYDYDIAA